MALTQTWRSPQSLRLDTARIRDVSNREKGDGFSIAGARLEKIPDLTELAKNYGLGELKPICGDHHPYPLDWSKVVA